MDKSWSGVKTKNDERQLGETGGAQKYIEESGKGGEVGSQSDYGLNDIPLPKKTTRNLIFRNYSLVLETN